MWPLAWNKSIDNLDIRYGVNNAVLIEKYNTIPYQIQVNTNDLMTNRKFPFVWIVLAIERGKHTKQLAANLHCHSMVFCVLRNYATDNFVFRPSLDDSMHDEPWFTHFHWHSVVLWSACVLSHLPIQLSIENIKFIVSNTWINWFLMWTICVRIRGAQVHKATKCEYTAKWITWYSNNMPSKYV